MRRPLGISPIRIRQEALGFLFFPKTDALPNGFQLLKAKGGIGRNSLAAGRKSQDGLPQVALIAHAVGVEALLQRLVALCVYLVEFLTACDA